MALTGVDVAHFWGALVLLGLGWNFGFIGATAVVVDCASPSERAKLQGLNDFVVFGTVACASFLAGSLLHSDGWPTVNMLVLPVVVVTLATLVWRAALGRGIARSAPV